MDMEAEGLSLYDYELDPPKGDVGRKEEQIRRRANGATHFLARTQIRLTNVKPTIGRRASLAAKLR